MKKIVVVLVVFFLSISSYSQTDNEYEETSFQGSEEQSYKPKKEVFLINSATISRKYIVFGELPNKNSHSIIVDYEKKTLTITLDKKQELYTLNQEDDEYYWGAMPQYNLVKGYLINEKNEKSLFVVEGGANGSIIFTIDKNMKNMTDTFNAGLKNR
jgi:hypothetical protein